MMNLLHVIPEAGTHFESVKIFENENSRQVRNSWLNEFRKLKTISSK